jgi:hypothetical protein
MNTVTADDTIRLLRATPGLSDRVARACGISRQAVRQWKRVPPGRADDVARFLLLPDARPGARPDARPIPAIAPGEDIISVVRSTRGLPAKVARACKVSRPAVYQWKQVPVRHIHKIARLLNVDAEQVRPDIFNTTTTEAEVTVLTEQIKAAVLRDLTPQALADHLLIAQGEDDLEEAVATALKHLEKAAARLHSKRVLNGRTRDQLSDEEDEKLTEPVSSAYAIIRDLVDDYGVEQVCKWAKTAGEEDAQWEADTAEVLAKAADEDE